MIKVENLHKRFSVKDVLCGVDIEVRDGETLVIIDSSGIGLARAVAYPLHCILNDALQR